MARVDEGPVQVWHVGDPEHPERPPAEHRYPAAGTDNAVVESPLSTTIFVFNTSRPPFNDLNMRRAVQLTVDVAQINTLVYGNITEPALTFFSPVYGS